MISVNYNFYGPTVLSYRPKNTITELLEAVTTKGLSTKKIDEKKSQTKRNEPLPKITKLISYYENKSLKQTFLS